MTDNRVSSPAVNRMARPPLNGAASAASLTPKDIFTILRRHIWLIVILMFLGFMAGGVSWFLLRRYSPQYTASTVIRVLPVTETDPLQLGGALPNKDLQYWARNSIANQIRQQGNLQQLLARDAVRETNWFQSFGETEQERVTEAYKDLEGHLGVSAQREGDFVVISMTCGSKTESALIVNEMVNMFITSQGVTKREEVAQKLAQLDSQRQQIQRQLDQSQAALNEIRRVTGFSDLDEHQWQPTITLKLNDLEDQQNELMLNIRHVETSIQTLQRQATGPINEQVEQQIETDPIMIRLAQQLSDEEAQLKSTLTKFGENHRVVRQIKELIRATKNERQLRRAFIAEQTRQANLKNAQDQLVAWMARAEELKAMQEEARRQQEDLNNARVLYQERLVVRDERQRQLDEIKAHIEKLNIKHDDPETPKVQFVARAPEPLEISSPKWQVFFPGGFMLGLMAGVGLAFLIELTNDIIRTPRDVARFLRIPLLGMVPDSCEDPLLEGIDLNHVVNQAPYSMISESYRRFRTNLKLSESAEGSKVLLVSSGKSSDGKTTIASNLASSLVAEGRRVLIIDANFWRPDLHKVFPNGQYMSEDKTQMLRGLSTVLTGKHRPEEAIRTTGLEGFDIIDAGPIPQNPAEMLGGKQMAELIKEQKQNYDYIIIDAPPILLVSDVKMLARFVDGTIIVLNAVSTRRGAALRTIQELKQVNAHIAGGVLFGVKSLKGGYFHEQLKSHQEYQKLHLAPAAN